MNTGDPQPKGGTVKRMCMGLGFHWFSTLPDEHGVERLAEGASHTLGRTKTVACMSAARSSVA